MNSALDLSYILFPLLLVFGFAFGWNNSGLTTGNLSNLVNYNMALALTIAGVFTGLLILGGRMSSSIIGKLVSTNIPSSAILAGIIVSVALLILLTVFRLPVSLSNCVVGSFLGAALASQSSVHTTFLIEIVGSWLAAPFLCAIITILAYGIVVKLENRFALSTVSLVNRMLLVIAVFYVSFTLGANNIGLIVSFARNNSLVGSNIILEISIFLATSLGMILFGKSIAKVVGDKIVVLSQIKTLSAMLGSAIVASLFTVLSVPVSLTQVVIGGMLGAGVAHRPSIVNTRELFILILGWAIVTIVSAGLAFGLAYLMLNY
ncbi:MAG: inorganic phosphate transporter [Nitrososphaerales archaeon]